MIGTIIGAGASVVGGILAGNQASKARKRAAKVMDDAKRRAEGIYERDYNQDYTQTASAQNALRKARELADAYTTRAEGTKAVMGGTDEAVANTKAEANKAIADVTSQIASEGQNRADRASAQYNAAMDALDKQKAAYENATAENIAKAGSQVMQAGMNMASEDIKNNMFGLTKEH